MFFRIVSALVISLNVYTVAQAQPSQEIEASLQLGHTETISEIAFNREGSLIVTASADHSAILWDAETGRQIRTFSGHQREVTSAIFIPNSDHIATSSWDNTIRIWDGLTGKELSQFEEKLAPLALVASEDGSLLAVQLEDKEVGIWDSTLTQNLGGQSNFRLGGFSSVISNTVMLIGAVENNIVAWQPGSNKSPEIIGQHFDEITSINVSPNGMFVVTTSEAGSRMWNIKNRTLKLEVPEGYRHSPRQPAIFSTNSSTVFLLIDREITEYSTRTGEKLRSITIDHYFEIVDEYAVLPSGKSFLFADNYANDFRLDLSDGSNGIQTSNTYAPIFERSSASKSDVSFSPLGDKAAVVSHVAVASNDHNAYVWNLARGERLPAFTGHQGPVDTVEFGSDGKKLLTGSLDGSGILWDITQQTSTEQYNGYSDAWGGKAIFAENNKKILTFQSAGAILWDTFSGKKVTQNKDIGSSSTYNASKKLFASLETRGSFPNESTMIWLHDASDIDRLINSPEGTKIQGLYDQDNTNYGIKFSPDGRFIASYGPDGTRIWDLRNANSNSSPLFDKYTSSRDQDVTFSQGKGLRVLIASEDHTITLWDWINNRHLRTFTGHRGIVTSVNFNPDGRTFASSSTDGTIRIWDIESSRELAQFISFDDGSWLAMTPEGYFNASDFTAAEKINIVRGYDILPLDSFYSTLYRPDLVREALFGDPDGKLAAASKINNFAKLWDSGQPPMIERVEIAGGETTDLERVQVSVDVTARNGGIGRIEIRVNGATQYVDNLALAQGADNAINVKVPVFLTAGNNKIEVVAYNKSNLVVSLPGSAIIQSSYEPPNLPALHILAMGIDDYVDERLNLNHAENDAIAVSAAFQKIGYKTFSEVVVHSVSSTDVVPENLEEKFEKISKLIKPEDVFLFFIAGHGLTIDGNYYFLHHDLILDGVESVVENAIGLETWQRWFASIPASRSVLLFDTCESGSIAREENDLGLETKGAIERLKRATGRTIISASTDTQPSLEGYGGHGVFTYSLLEAIGAGDRDKDGQLEVTELAAYVEEHLPQISYAKFGHRQVPQMSIHGSSFSLGQPETVLRPQ